MVYNGIKRKFYMFFENCIEQLTVRAIYQKTFPPPFRHICPILTTGVQLSLVKNETGSTVEST